MNYIYNIKANFQKEYYDYFEWNKEDKIITLKKTPIFKVNKKTFIDIKNNEVKINAKFNTLIICTDSSALIIKNKNNTIYKSDVNYNQLENILTKTNKLKTKTIDYTIVKKNKINFKTRKQKEIEKKCYDTINTIIKNKKYSAIKYLYFECYNKEENNITKIKKLLTEELKNEKKNYQKIINYFNLIKKG